MKKNINLIIVKDYDEMSQKAFEFFKDEIKNGATNLGMATGSTPIGLYKLFKEDYKVNKFYENLNYFNLDEYHGLKKEHPESYFSFMKKQLFDEINATNCFIPNGEEEIESAITTYQAILDSNQIDVQLLGVGNNGHIGFNEPGTPFDIGTNFVRLKNSTREANKRFFNNNIDDVPEFAITMGISDIMKARKVVVLANGESKSTAVREMIFGEVNELCPASVLQNHPDVTVIIDYKAASKLPLHTLSVDISSTRIKVATFDSNYERVKYEVISHNCDNIYENMKEMIERQLEKDIFKLGVSISGYVNNGVVTHPATNLYNFDLKSRLESDFELEIAILNRANSSALGEYNVNFKDTSSLYYISLGCGIGGGYISNNQVINGKHGFAGEISNMIIDTKAFGDKFFADGSIELHYNHYKESKDTELFVKQISTVLANIVNTVDPEVLVVDIKNLEIDKSLTKDIEVALNSYLYYTGESIKVHDSELVDESLLGAAIYVNNN